MTIEYPLTPDEDPSATPPEVTVDDPKTWTKPWKIAYPLRHDPDYDYIAEYACHEGNIFRGDALAGARADEKRAADAAAQKGVR